MTTLSVLVVVLLALRCHAHVNFGACNLQCEGDGDGSSSSNPPQPPIRIQGAPGKRGVMGLTGSKGDQGLRGPKGDPAEKCQCRDIEDLKRELFPQTCDDFLPSQGVDNNAVYSIYPYGNGDMTHLRVYCDLKTDGGSWIVFQKRIDGSEDFYRNFNDYVNGFGRLDGEFWLGLDALHKLTKDGEYEMRVDMEDFENQTRYALYRDFVVGVGTNYTMTFGGYSGTAGSALRSARFSAKDRDQDTHRSSCADLFKGGWWYTNCHGANPNGLYLGGPHESCADGVEWGPFRGYRYSLKRVEMKLRKK